jgi:hypothetical protein
MGHLLGAPVAARGIESRAESVARAHEGGYCPVAVNARSLGAEMDLRKTVTRGFAAAAIAAVPVFMAASPASAYEVHSKTIIVEHTFTDNAGDPVTCQVEYDSAISRGDTSSPFAAEADTQTFSSTSTDPEPCRSFVNVEIAYTDLAGRPQHARSFGSDFVDLQLDEVKGNVVATHQVFFLNCSANCETSGTTSPK